MSGNFIFNAVKFLIPQLISVISIFYGWLSMMIPSLSFYFLGISSICDGMDGFIARKLNAESKFGVIMDSVCDLFNFCFVPSIVLLRTSSIFLIIPVFWTSIIYFLSGFIRLIKFTFDEECQYTVIDNTKYFNGMPTPLAAMISVLSSVYYPTIISLPVNLILAYFMNSKCKVQKIDFSRLSTYDWKKAFLL